MPDISQCSTFWAAPISARSAAVSFFFFPSAMTFSPYSTIPIMPLQAFALGLCQQVEELLEPLDLGFGFLQMRLEQLLQLRNRTNSWALILEMIGLGEPS